MGGDSIHKSGKLGGHHQGETELWRSSFPSLLRFVILHLAEHIVLSCTEKLGANEIRNFLAKGGALDWLCIGEITVPFGDVIFFFFFFPSNKYLV